MKKLITIALVLFFNQQTITQEKSPLGNQRIIIKSFWKEKIEVTKGVGMVLALYGVKNVLKQPLKGLVFGGIGAAIIYNYQQINSLLDEQKPHFEKYLRDLILCKKEEVELEKNKDQNSKEN